MRLILVVALVECAAPPRSRPSDPQATHDKAYAIPVADGRWDLRHTARVDAGHIALSYCCTRVGIAMRRLPPLPVGSWGIEIDHTNSECTQGARAIVARADAGSALEPSLGFVVLDAEAGAAGGVTTLTFDVAHAAPLEIRVMTEGGLHCCGTTTIRSIVLRNLPEKLEARSVKYVGEKDAYEALWLGMSRSGKGIGAPRS